MHILSTRVHYECWAREFLTFLEVDEESTFVLERFLYDVEIEVKFKGSVGVFLQRNTKSEITVLKYIKQNNRDKNCVNQSNFDNLQ